MTKIGRINNLKIIKTVDFGVYLDGENLGEILLPKRYIPENSKLNDKLDVFIYFDSENRIIATTETPKVMVGECAFLKVVSNNSSVGAFLDWGLPKDLLVPLSEQRKEMQINKSYVVYVYLDDRTERIVASTKISKHLNKIPNKKKYEQDEIVDLLIFEETEIGFNVIVNNSTVGLLYKNETFQALEEGQKIKGFVKKVRSDGKIDLCLNKSNYQYISVNSEKILEYLKAQGGSANISDKTPPENIYKIFGISKKVFKDALGDLYKKKLIKIKETGVEIVEK
jgi:hypothetical protein